MRSVVHRNVVMRRVTVRGKKTELIVLCCTPSVLRSNTRQFHPQLTVQYFCTHYTQLLHVSAIYPGHLQGVTSLVEVCSVYGKLL